MNTKTELLKEHFRLIQHDIHDIFNIGIVGSMVCIYCADITKINQSFCITTNRKCDICKKIYFINLNIDGFWYELLHTRLDRFKNFYKKNPALCTLLLIYMSFLKKKTFVKKYDKLSTYLLKYLYPNIPIDIL